MAKQKTLHDKHCAVCGVLFRPKSALQKCCSQKCGHEFKKTRKPEPCAHCGGLFLKRHPAQKLCSDECRAEARKVNRTVKCATCGADFVRPHGKYRTYCSLRCAMLARNKPGRGASKPVGSTVLIADGYVREKTNDGKWEQQHRLVMQRHIGRKLERTEYVHHKNGVRSDNRIENLELWVTKGKSKKDPHGQRLEDALKDLLSQPEIVGVERLVEAAFRRVFHIEAK